MIFRITIIPSITYSTFADESYSRSFKRRASNMAVRASAAGIANRVFVKMMLVRKD
jgi:hypothetical protein